MSLTSHRTSDFGRNGLGPTWYFSNYLFDVGGTCENKTGRKIENIRKFVHGNSLQMENTDGVTDKHLRHLDAIDYNAGRVQHIKKQARLHARPTVCSAGRI